MSAPSQLHVEGAFGTVPMNLASLLFPGCCDLPAVRSHRQSHHSRVVEVVLEDEAVAIVVQGLPANFSRRLHASVGPSLGYDGGVAFDFLLVGGRIGLLTTIVEMTEKVVVMMRWQ